MNTTALIPLHLYGEVTFEAERLLFDHAAEKNASYNTRVTRGTHVRALRPILAFRRDGDAIQHAVVPMGATFVVTTESNAGFRGIELTAFLPEGAAPPRFIVSVSTGAVEVVS